MIRPITDTIRHIDGGYLVDRASRMMNQLVKDIDASGGSGKIALEIHIKNEGNGVMRVTGKIKIAKSKPIEPLMMSFLYATPEGNLTTENPSQKKLDLEIVPKPDLEDDLTTALFKGMAAGKITP